MENLLLNEKSNKQNTSLVNSFQTLVKQEVFYSGTF